MDPNETLKELRETVNSMTAEESEEQTDKAYRVVELFNALDGWISKGGFLPDAWKKPVDVGPSPSQKRMAVGDRGVW